MGKHHSSYRTKRKGCLAQGQHCHNAKPSKAFQERKHLPISLANIVVDIQNMSQPSVYNAVWSR